MYVKVPSPAEKAVSVPIVEYTPDRFGDLREMVARIPGPLNLAHRPFVDYYYTTHDCCKLYLYYSESGKIIGTLGRELAPFIHNSREITVRIGTNWYSLQRGVGGELYQYSARANPDSIGLMFGGSRNTLDILHHHNWTFMPGIQAFFLNNPYTIYPSDPWWRRASKSFLRGWTRKRISSFDSRLPASVRAEITVREEHQYSDDLLPSCSPFTFRLAPAAEYLSWRYCLSLSFIHYRLFRIMVRGESSGYVILSDSPRQIIVAQCDANDPSALAYGVLLSVFEVGRSDSEPRKVFLTSSHPQMQTIFRKFGFHRQRGYEQPFAFRTPPAGLDPARDTSNWLINFDWGDNGLRPPFPDQDRAALKRVEMQKEQVPSGI
jgi:hypothetical protein